MSGKSRWHHERPLVLQYEGAYLFSWQMIKTEVQLC
jgi:hypothetical protein